MDGHICNGLPMRGPSLAECTQHWDIVKEIFFCVLGDLLCVIERLYFNAEHLKVLNLTVIPWEVKRDVQQSQQQLMKIIILAKDRPTLIL